MLLSFYSKGQNYAAFVQYNSDIKASDSCYNAKNIKEALVFYKKASQSKPLTKIDMLAAASVAAEYKDKKLAFQYLSNLIDRNWADTLTLSKEPAFDFLKTSPKWKKLYAKAVKIKKELGQYTVFLEQIYAEDQLMRKDTLAFFKKYGKAFGMDTSSVHFSNKRILDIVDSIHYTQVKPILDKEGWLSIWTTSQKANTALFLAIDHYNNLEIMKKWLPIVYASGQIICSRPSDAAILEDQILVEQGKPQKYGCMNRYDAKKGYLIIYPVQDKTKINEWRKMAMIKPLEEHMLKRNIRWE
jgi:hypothetical protein